MCDVCSFSSTAPTLWMLFFLFLGCYNFSYFFFLLLDVCVALICVFIITLSSSFSFTLILLICMFHIVFNCAFFTCFLPHLCCYWLFHIIISFFSFSCAILNQGYRVLTQGGLLFQRGSCFGCSGRVRGCL